MKRALAVILILVLFAGMFLVFNLNLGSAQVATQVNGIIKQDTVWTKAGSPYILTGPVAVKNGVTLTIDPGVSVNINFFSLQVNGSLVARGTDAYPIDIYNGTITFTAVSSGWNEQTGSGCIIEKANLHQITDQYGNYNDASSIIINGSSPKLANNINIDYLTVSGGSPIISNNNIGNLEIDGGVAYILENIIWGVSLRGGSPLISGNSIGTGINCYGMDLGVGSPIIWNNSITVPGGTDVSVISLAFSGQVIVSNNKIIGGSTGVTQGLWGRTSGPYYTAYGLRVQGNAVVSNNIIFNCTVASMILSSGDGVADIKVLNNTLSGTGIQIKGQVLASINGNNIQGGLTLKEPASNNVDASSNWWGTVDSSAIAELIVDSNDNYNLGTVTFSPFLTAPNSLAVPDVNAAAPTPNSVPSLTPAPSNSQSIQPSMNPTQTATSSTQPSIESSAQSVNLLEIGIFTVLIAIALLLVAILVSVRKKKQLS